MSKQRPSTATINYDDVLKLDSRLQAMNLRRHSLPSDGDSFYSAVADQIDVIGHDAISHSDVRRKCVVFLRKNRLLNGIDWTASVSLAKEQFLNRHKYEGTYADDVMIQAVASSMNYVINIVTIWQVTTVLPKEGVKRGHKGVLWVGRVDREHYVSLHKTSEVSNSQPMELFSFAGQATSPSGILKQSPNTDVYFAPEFIVDEQLYNEGMNGPGMNPSESLRRNMEFEENYIDDDETPIYDQYTCEPPEDESRTSSNTLKFFTKSFKLLSYLIFGSCVFVGGLVGKATFLVLGNGAKVYTPEAKTPEGDRLEHDMLRAWAYIALLCAALFPEVLAMGYSLYRIIMKRESPLDMSTLLWGGLWEFLSCVGEGLLFFKVLPHMDATYATLVFPLVALTAICVNIHAKWLSVSHNRRRNAANVKRDKATAFALAILALVLQGAGIASLFILPGIWPTEFAFLTRDYTQFWALGGIVLTSLRYWENFITDEISLPFGLKIRARSLHQALDHSRFKASFIFSIMKSLVLTGMAFLVFVVLENETYTSDHVNKHPAYSMDRFTTIANIFEVQGVRVSTSSRISTSLFYVFATHGCCAFAAFFFGRVACLTCIQRESYTIPVVLVTPAISACAAALAVFKFVYSSENGLLQFAGLPRSYYYLQWYVDWNIQMIPGGSLDAGVLGLGAVNGIMAAMVIVGLCFGWAAMIIITLFIWKPTQNRLERTEVLFVQAIYGGPLVDQALMMNRRQFEKEYAKSKAKKDEEMETKRSRSEASRRSTSGRMSTRRRMSRRLTLAKSHKFTPQLFLCATMWHETEQEMTQILTSLMRLDKDQGMRRAKSTTDQDYYNFQVHVLFDDAMERSSEGETKTNKFVHMLCELIPLAANKVELGKGYDLAAPVIYPTPYGGRLEFILPHGNLMVVHLKDKEKIRHRKRWSQCMYMYYILGYLQATKKAYKIDDVFLLALDGDVDFQPSAVLLLLDRMKRNPDVGAACGRIHPTGSGPVVWFQKFEYAVGHWLQKTTEHVLGCVLCSPGCFSLFRGSAIVDVNVMNRYTTKATEALHYVQWDQGEDRWLCTLLLKQGWRIEYSAASDSFTFAPEEFKEFYNQRRRWGPSTMANIFDILKDSALTVKNNMYISWGYIAYQIGLMISSLLGPATVIMVVQGAYSYVFGWDAAVALIVSLIPVIIFIILCYTTSGDTQVAVAGILTILYALVMCAVIVGVIGGLATAILDPNSLFMLMLVGLYAFTGIAHPQEMMCLIHGVLYYLCVPSAFIFLMVYSLVNMNNVSWGTREVKKAASEDDAAQNALQQVAGKPTGDGKSMQIGPQAGGGSIYDAPPSSDGYYSCGLGNLCQCALCITPKPVYVQVPVNEPRTTQPAPMQRRTTVHDQHSMIKKYSMAKKEQITGLNTDKLERRLSKRMSVKQLRKLSSKMDENLTTASLRRMSTYKRNMSRPSGSHTMSKVEQLTKELEQDEELAHSSSQNEYDDNFDDVEDEIDDDRLQEEGEEMLYWVMEGPLEDGVIEYLDDEEREFWKYLIKKYLYPLIEDKDEKARIKSDLVELRNKMTGAYFLLNALWLVLNFALQLAITDIAISFELGGTPVVVNPVSFAFLIFFFIILIIQFGCMLVHRWSTALHLLSVTSLKWEDSRDGFENIKQGQIDKADRKQAKKKVMARVAKSNGNVYNPEDPIDDVTDGPDGPEDNFTIGRLDSDNGRDNPTYDDPDRDVYEDSDSDNPYEEVKFGTLTKSFHDPRKFDNIQDPSRKQSSAINMHMFDDSAKTSEGQSKGKHARFAPSNDQSDEGNTQF